MRFLSPRVLAFVVSVVASISISCGGGSDGNGNNDNNGNNNGNKTITSVTVSCSPATIQPAQTSACTSTVNGTGNIDPSVTWSASPGTISQSGVYSPPNSVTASIQAVITAMSSQDPTQSGKFAITVNPAPVPAPSFLSISPFTLDGLGQKIMPIDLSLYVTGGTAPFTFAIVSQTLADSTVASINGKQFESDYSYHAGTNTVAVSVTDANQKQAQTTIQIVTAVPLVAYRLFMSDYSPYVGSQNPNNGTVVGDDQLIQQIGALAPYTMGIRTFGCTAGLQDVPSIAKRFGLKVYAGVWISNNTTANNNELQNCIAIAQTVGVDAMIIGSEALLRNDVAPAQLIAYINQFRAAVPNTPVTTADQYLPLENNPSVVADCDFVFANFYPFWEGVDVSKAVATLNEEFKLLQAAYPAKQIVVSETGWPSFGNPVGNAVPSPQNAAFYFLNFESWVQAEKIKASYFEDHDEPWKGTDDGWGIWDQNLVMKPGMEQVFDGVTMADNWTCQVIPGGSGTPALQFTSVPPIGSSVSLQGDAFHVSPTAYYVVVYIHVGPYGWWTKPYAAQPFTTIACDGSWSTNIDTGGGDASADQIAAFLIPTSYSPPILLGAGSLPQALYTNSVANTSVTRQ